MRRALSSKVRAERILLGLLVALPAFAGCTGPSFSYDAPIWHAGYGWEYEEQEKQRSSFSGDAPESVTGSEEGERVFNRTLRLEVFNSTALSVEGIPIYALAMRQQYIPDENISDEPASDYWDAWVYSEDLNLVRPTYVDWRNQEVQLSGQEGGVEETPTEGEETEETPADEESANQPEDELRRLDWPLTKGRTWRHAETIPDLDEEGVFDAKATRLASVRVPAGTFSAVKIHATLEPLDMSHFEEGIRNELEADGGEVDHVSFSYRTTFDYSYGEKILNLVDYREELRVVISASGADGDGDEYDFTYTSVTEITRKLTRHQIVDGLERPLTFAVDVKRGAYSPKPITAASHLAVEILAAAQQLNRYSDENVGFGLRIYNSTAGEKKVRPVDASYPAKGSFNADYDHDMLEIVWSVQNIDSKGRHFEFLKDTGDTIAFNAQSFATAGRKQVQATLKLKDTAESPGQEIFTDAVFFEVYSHTNVTFARLATNTTPPNNVVFVKFPVEATATRVYSTATLQGGQPAATACPFANPGNDCLRVTDDENRRVNDQRQQEQMKFETTSLGTYVMGLWGFEFTPSAPGQTVTFEIVVRYRAGA